MECGLKVELQQKLIMTPQLRQAIAMLQLSTLELAALVEQELADNPVLEVADSKNSQDASEQDDGQTDFSRCAEWMDYIHDGRDFEEGEASETGGSLFDMIADASYTLQEHLHLQLDLLHIDPQVRQAALFLIGSIDDNGYLRSTVTEAARAVGVPENAVAEALRIIHTFDPDGIGARDLRECLSLQARLRGIENKLVEVILDRFLADVAKGRYKAIADKLGVKPHDVQEAVDVIRKLNPRPGQVFGKNRPSYIVPDIVVEKIDNRYVILMNDSMVPRLTISPYYRRLAREADGETKRFVEGRMNAAVWVVKSIEQRRRTLYSIMEAIVKLQRDFFDYGPKYLRPLVMRQVAEATGVHESTVSRASANKYVATPHGLFSLRSFFSAGLQKKGGEDVAAAAVKREIRQLIADENSAAPYSDQALSNELKKRGIVVSRRTVTKYREELDIPASSLRKRY